MTEQRDYMVLIEKGAKPIKAWTHGVPFDDIAKTQVLNVARMPFIYRWIAVMPDVHAGKGSTIGSVIPTENAIIPSAVGVDIGCGMMAQRTTLAASDLPDDLGTIRQVIEAAVPHGRTDNGGANDRGAWGELPARVQKAWAGLTEKFEWLCERHPKLRRSNNDRHLGTLGTGNHFIEICLDEENRVWIMLHSGSRGVGGRIGSYFINVAKEAMRTWMIELPDPDLAYLPEGTQLFHDYLVAARWAQDYARINRELMMQAVVEAMKTHSELPAFPLEGDAVNCHHNYVAKENHFGRNVWVTRKGAVRARESDLGIIPGSMGARSYIVRGKGNEDSFHSCSHGAGRVMSRGQARRQLTLEDHRRATAHVECRKDADVIDESPAAYKSIDAVMEAQKNLVDVVHTLRQVVCVKG